MDFFNHSFNNSRMLPSPKLGKSLGQAAVIAAGLYFPECLRWHDGRWWFSDMKGRAVYSLKREEGAEPVKQLDVPGQAAGLGWLPGGDLVVVDMERRLLRRARPTAGASTLHADLSSVFDWNANELVMDKAGNAYVGNFGCSADFKSGIKPTVIARVSVGGSVSVAAEDLLFPNGMVFTDDGRTLVVAETMAKRLTAFDVAPDGALLNRRVWATTKHSPDGIAADTEGGIWVSHALKPHVARYVEGAAEPTHSVSLSQGGFCVGLSPTGELTACTSDIRREEKGTGKIEAIQVDFRGYAC